MTDHLDVAAYGRNSDPKQKTSQAIQDDAFQHFASSEDGFKSLFGKKANIVENYKDHGKSASKKKGKREDFNRMLADVASGKMKIVLVLNTSRFARLHPVDTLKFLATFRDADAKLVSIQDAKIIEVEELGDLITNIVKFHSDHEYSRTLAANALRGTIHAVKTRATAHVSAIPYGMMKLVITDTGEQRTYPRTSNIRIAKDWRSYLVPGDEQEQVIVRWIFNTYLDEDLSKCEIARRLNNHDNPQVRAGYSGKGWDDCRIGWILANRHYRGQEFIGNNPEGEHYRAMDGQAVVKKQAKEVKPLIVEGKHGHVVSPEIFEKVQQKLQRKKGKKPKCLNSDGYSLTGLLVCGHCGHSLLANGTGKFVCKSNKGGKTSCRTWGIEETEVLPWLVARIDKELIRTIQEKVPTPVDDSEVRTIDAKIQTINAQLTDPSTTVEACKSLAGVVKSLGEEKEHLQSKLHADTYHHRLLAAYERWEEMVQPYLVAMKTGTAGEGVEAVEVLGIGEEVDRLFNFTYAKASKVRELLQGMDTKVVCYFKTVAPTDKRSKGRRFSHELDRGQVTITLNGITTPAPQQGNIRQGASRLLSLIVRREET